MSDTNYKVFNSNTYEDLSHLFESLSQGQSSSITTNYKVGNQDLNQIFASIDSPGAIPIGFNTNFKVGTQDLTEIFASKNSDTPFLTTSQFLTTQAGYNKSNTTLASGFTIPSGYQSFNFILYGGGGNASQTGSYTYGSGGAGAGAYIKATDIKYSNNGDVISKIVYKISGGQSNGSNYDTQVNITYTSGKSINLIAGSGKSTDINSGTTGANGGVTSHTVTTGVPVTIVASVDGKAGGNQGSNGQSNGYTSSGSGNNGGSTAPIGNPPGQQITTATPDGDSYIIESYGGGTTQTVQGYGAAGAATPANYLSNAPAHRYGKQGCILFYLS